MLNYLKFFKKVQVSDVSEKLLTVPENGFFSDQAGHTFQLKIQRTENSRANQVRKRCEKFEHQCPRDKKNIPRDKINLLGGEMSNQLG